MAMHYVSRTGLSRAVAKIRELLRGKQDTIQAVGLLKGDGNHVTAATATMDYATPSQLEAAAQHKQNVITATGLLKGTGSAVVAATAGTDYVTPAGLSSELSAYLPKSGGSIEGPLAPAQYDSISLGSSGMPWSAVHASVFDGDSAQISGTVYSEGMEVSGTIRPTANNGGGLGDASRYFGTAYIGTVNARLASVTGKIYSEGKEVWSKGSLKIATGYLEGVYGETANYVSLGSYGFTKTPSVFVNLQTSGPNIVHAAARDINTSGFNVFLKGGNSGNKAGVNWIAISLE